MKIVFVTDLHGAHEWVAALVAEAGGAELLLCGGDLTNFSGEAEAARILAPLREAFGRVLGVAGNTDRLSVLKWLDDEGLSLHGRGVPVGGLWVSGVSGSNHTPLKSPLEFDETQLASLLEQGRPPESEADRPWILVTHVPPADTVADRMFAGKHVGSPALREFLEPPLPVRRPALALCGHIHEGESLETVSVTQLCNPGPLGAGKYALITVADGQLSCEQRRLHLPVWRRTPAAALSFGRKVAGYLGHRVRRFRSERRERSKP